MTDDEFAMVFARLVTVAAIFLNEDERFQVAVSGNPNAVDKMLAEVRGVLAKARGR